MLLLSQAPDANMTIDRLIAYDFISLYGRHFDLAEANLHGENEYGFSELSARRAVMQAALKELDMAISNLRKAAAAINDVADILTEMFSDSATKEAPTPEPPITLEQVRAVLAEKSRQGHTVEIRTLLQKYGATKLSQIDPVHYKALVAEAEVMTDAT